MINQFVRNQKSKFFISKNDYQNKFYPNYIGGPWLIPGQLIGQLYELAITKSLPALPFEDVFITGIVASKLRPPVKRQQLNGLIYWPNIQSIDYCFFNNSTIFWQGFTDETLMFSWIKIIKTKKKHCKHK